MNKRVNSFRDNACELSATHCRNVANNRTVGRVPPQPSAMLLKMTYYSEIFQGSPLYQGRIKAQAN